MPTEGTRDLVVLADQSEQLSLKKFGPADDWQAELWIAARDGLAAVGSAEPTNVGATGSSAISRIQQLGHISGAPAAWHVGMNWKRSMRGLAVLTGWRHRDIAWIVVGSTFSDFALAHALGRMNLNTVWIPEEWLSPSASGANAARSLLEEVRTRTFHTEGRLVSTSMDLTAPKSSCEALSPYGMVGRSADWLTTCAMSEVTQQLGESLIVLTDDYAKDMALPIRVSRHGDRTLVNRLPSLLPETAGVFDGPQLDWVIGIAFADHPMPRGRGLPPDPLETADSVWQERIRSGRDGTSVMSSSHGFVVAGGPRSQAVARPRLAAPSTSTWAREMAGADEAQLATSDAGNVAQVSGRFWPSRAAMSDDIAAFRPIFMSFLTKSQNSKDRYPAGDGVVLRQEGYPTFAYMRSVLPGTTLSTPDLRTLVDSLTNRGAFRRGFILKCPSCAQVQFLTPSGPDFAAPCARCAERVPLTQPTWNKPLNEPDWFYDLHPMLRRLLTDAGDVSLLAERHLRRTERQIVGIPEIDIFKSGSLLCEVDLLAASPTLVVVGECKAQPALKAEERVKKIKGLVQAAHIFRADQIVLAAGATGSWPDVVAAQLLASVEQSTWTSGTAPRVRMISGLWQDEVADLEATTAGQIGFRQ